MGNLDVVLVTMPSQTLGPDTGLRLDIINILICSVSKLNVQYQLVIFPVSVLHISFKTSKLNENSENMN